MATYVLTEARLAAYALRFDFRTPICRVGRVILDSGGIAALGPGEGLRKLPRYFTSVDFQRGAATGRKSPPALGDRRYMEYSEFFGIFTVMNTVPMETEEKTGSQYLDEDHARELERLTGLEDALFMEHAGMFTEALLPYHEVTEMFPIEPDERPEGDREVNAAFRRWRLKVNIRYDGWPTT